METVMKSLFNSTKNEETVPCKLCGEPTIMLGTKKCDNCWEVISRLSTFLDSRKARDLTRKLLSQKEEVIYFQHIRDTSGTISTKTVRRYYKDYCESIQEKKQEPLSFVKWYSLAGYVPVKK